MAHNLWKRSIKFYYLRLKCARNRPADLQVGTLHTLWAAGKNSHITPKSDNGVRTVEGEMGSRADLRPVARVRVRTWAVHISTGHLEAVVEKAQILYQPLSLRCLNNSRRESAHQLSHSSPAEDRSSV